MTKKQITIDGKEYVLKEETKDFKHSEYFIMDSAIVLAIVPLNRETQLDDEENIDLGSYGTFKKFEGKITLHRINKKTFNAEIFKLEKTRYSIELLNQARKTSRPFYGSSEPIFYKKFEDEKFVEDHPCLVNFGGMIFTIAPRIETEDED